ncbi:MAG: DUF4282 domain-containing protein [Calothrix sp. C42_A2020_038]|nr:DUF4282 domain-containing protein [Calothrix sp. C42_A2020_038]
MSKPSNFFAKLFDFSFSQFIALRVVGILYALAIAVLGLVAIIYLVLSFSQGLMPGLITLIMAPLIFLLYVILIRIGLESMIITFRIADHTRIIAENSEKLREL